MKNKRTKFLLYILFALAAALIFFIILNWDGFMIGIRAGSQMAE